MRIKIFILLLLLVSPLLSQRAGLPYSVGQPTVTDQIRSVTAGENGTYYGWIPGRSRLTQFDRKGNVLQETEILANGTIVSSCVYDGEAKSLWVSGRLVVKYGADEYRAYSILKLRTDLSIDPSFAPLELLYSEGHSSHNPVNQIILDVDGRVLLAGEFDSVNSTPARTLISVSPDGSFQTRHAPPGGIIRMAKTSTGYLFANQDGLYHSETLEDAPKKVSNQLARISAGTLTYHPKYGIAIFAQYPGEGTRVHVFNEDGQRDLKWNAGADFDRPIHSLTWDSEGRLLVAGSRLSILGREDPGFTLTRLDAVGAVDQTWSRSVFFDRPASFVAELSDGDYLVYGDFSRVNGFTFPGAIKVNAEAVGEAPQSVNHSARGYVEGGKQKFIMGFILSGDKWTETLVRAIGPSLQQFGVGKTPASTKTELHTRSALLLGASGDEAQPNASPAPYVREMIAKAGAFPSGFPGAEVQFVTALPPGAYTVVIDAPDGQAGEVLGEIYHP